MPSAVWEKKQRKQKYCVSERVNDYVTEVYDRRSFKCYWIIVSQWLVSLKMFNLEQKK